VSRLEGVTKGGGHRLSLVPDLAVTAPRVVQNVDSIVSLSTAALARQGSGAFVVGVRLSR
jgi:hypothetical protein